MTETSRVIRVAAVQMESQNARVEANLQRATGFVEQAAALGAKLVLLPEFMPPGYIFTDDIWDGAEPSQGPTVRWMKKTSERLGIWIGTSFLEAEGEDFYNTFVLTNPDGQEDGRVRKQTPAVGEALYTKGEAGPHVINSRLCRVGVGICLENQFTYTARNAYRNGADILLQPHSSPAPTPNRLLTPEAVERHKEMLRNRPVMFARMLGIPAIFCNHAGQWRSPMPGIAWLNQDTHFDGLTSIVDSDGRPVARLGGEEGVIAGDVTLDPERKAKSPPPVRGKYILPGSWWQRVITLTIEASYGLAYRLSKKRKLRARAISGM